ncbi:MAG TPA: hypothetical protein VN829_22180 [Dongiaceae bacterium]|nr:exported hypothetical protein [Verrucomicrobiota bacterium]HXP63226.1 hypothetical protein [Dongiaceae bacterium]
MKNKILFTLLALAGGSLLAADSGPKDDLIAAAKKMVQQGYSWRTTLEMGNFSNVSDGKVDKDGLVQLTLTFNDSTTQVFLKDKKGAVKLPDQEWQSLEELTSPDNTQRGPGRFMGRMLRDYKAPATQVAELFDKIKQLNKDGDSYSADLTEAGAKTLLTMGGGRRGGNAPEASNAKGSVRIALKDGLVSKFELRLQGTMTINGEDREINRTVTVEVRDIGKTRLEVPAAAKEKLS